MYAVVTANDDTNGLLLAVRYLANGNILVNVTNPTASPITPLFTRINVRIYN